MLKMMEEGEEPEPKMEEPAVDHRGWLLNRVEPLLYQTPISLMYKSVLCSLSLSYTSFPYQRIHSLIDLIGFGDELRKLFSDEVEHNGNGRTANGPMCKLFYTLANS